MRWHEGLEWAGGAGGVRGRSAFDGGKYVGQRICFLGPSRMLSASYREKEDDNQPLINAKTQCILMPVYIKTSAASCFRLFPQVVNLPEKYQLYS